MNTKFESKPVLIVAAKVTEGSDMRTSNTACLGISDY
jgi:hypothetical protein